MSDDQIPGDATHDAEKTPDAEKKKKKKDKVRSAWISFVGRIIAQAVGAAATVVLGLSVLHSYSAPGNVQAAGPSQPAGNVFVAILPIDTFSSDPAGAGKRVRIIVQLIESDDQPVREDFALQAEIASAIAKAISSPPPRGQQTLLR